MSSHFWRTSLAALLCLSTMPILMGVPAADDGQAQMEVVAAEGMKDWDRINLERNLRWILARERSRGVIKDSQAGRLRVGVFADAGVWHVGARSIVEALEKQGVSCRALDRSMMRNEELSRFDAIVLPGGWAPFQWAALGEPGLAALQQYVGKGGRCLGICAGAYLISKTTQYDGASYAYPLGLFDGIAKGPVEGLARYPKPGEAKLSVTAEGRKRGLAGLSGAPFYYSGGPCFEGGTGVEVLARYPNDRPAAIRRKVGKGQVVLIGVQLERPTPEKGDDHAPPPEIAGALLKALLSTD